MTLFRVVSDIICPWCYIGKRRLEAALEHLPDEVAGSVSWHPFQLNPDMPRTGMDRREYCTRKFGSWARCEEMFERISEVGKSVGLTFTFNLQPTIPNTLDVHRIIWLGGREGVQDALVETFFRAYFCEGVDFSDSDELIETAVNAGFERKALERFLKSQEGAAEVLNEEQEVKSLGVSSVPLFIIGDRLAVSGAQPPETLLQAVEQVGFKLPAKPTPSPVSSPHSSGPEECKT